MRRVFGDYAYGPGPRAGCFWDNTCEIAARPRQTGDISADVAVIGAGFTGLNAALVLAEGGADVVVIDAEQPGFGASGRNGGFCCLGGGYASDAWLDKRYGLSARLAWRRAEVDAVAHVEALIARFDLDVDRHSEGETLLAHRPMDFAVDAERVEENYGVTPQVLAKEDLPANGLSGPFHGALTVPVGFGLNPRKYLAGLLDAVDHAGVRVFGDTRAGIIEDGRLRTQHGCIHADRVLVATNGYSSEDVPDWLAGRYMPAQSTVLVTEPLTEDQLQAAGWTSDQMCYDSRNLLHYFRLMPDRRFLFGMRGGLLSGARADAAARQAVFRHFAQMFPAWSDVKLEGTWGGFVAMARHRMPFVGDIPGTQHLAAMCYHGNGVAMGSYAGMLAGQKILGAPVEVPDVMGRPLARFPFGRFRRVLMPPIYAALSLAD